MLRRLHSFQLHQAQHNWLPCQYLTVLSWLHARLFRFLCALVCVCVCARLCVLACVYVCVCVCVSFALCCVNSLTWTYPAVHRLVKEYQDSGTDMGLVSGAKFETSVRGVNVWSIPPPFLLAVDSICLNFPWTCCLALSITEDTSLEHYSGL